MTDKATPKTIGIKDISNPAASVVNIALPSPAASSSATKQKFETVKVKVPVRFAWSPGQKEAPFVQPLKGVIDANRPTHIASVSLAETHSNAPATQPALFEGLESTASDEPAHKLELLKSGTGVSPSFIVHPNSHKNINEKLWTNPNPPNFAVGGTPSEPVSIDKLREGVVTLSAKSVAVNATDSPQLYSLLQSRLSKLGNNAKASTSPLSGKMIEVSTTELTKFLDEYKNKIGAPELPKSNPLDHKLVLKTWANGDHFGKEVAETAVHGDLRNQLLAADTNHEVVTTLEYELIHPVAGK